MYIGAHIDYHENPIYYENYAFENVSVFNNIIRLIMGIPKTTNGYIGISQKYWFEIVIKIIIAICLFIHLIVEKIKYRKDEVEKRRNGCFIIVFKIILSSFLIFIYLIYLYLTYISINCIR